MPVTLLVVDDDDDLRTVTTLWLERSGYHTIPAADGLQGLRLFHEHHPQLAILDVNMPNMDGWTMAGRIREISNIPIIMLTAKSGKEDRLHGFDLGVDDYITKPFFPEELVARVGTILKRTQMQPAAPQPRSPPTRITRGKLTIDLVIRRVMRAGKVIQLSPTEFHLLAALASNPGVPQSSQTLLTTVWGATAYRNEDNVRTYIRYLREKLEEYPAEPSLIITERGFGYYLA